MYIVCMHFDYSLKMEKEDGKKDTDMYNKKYSHKIPAVVHTCPPTYTASRKGQMSQFSGETNQCILYIQAHEQNCCHFQGIMYETSVFMG